MSYFCSTCSINLSCSKALKRHDTSKKHLKRLENNLKYICHCGRTFTQSSNLYRHKKNCNQTQPETNTETKINQPEQKLQLLQKENQEMREEMDELKKQVDGMDELRKQVEMLLSKSTKNTTNNIQTLNSIENQNVHIVVNSFGHENIDHLTDQIICKLIKTAPFTSVPLLIEKIHFDPEHPENHNIKITNKKLNYAEVVKNNKWVTANKKKVIDDVIQKSYDLLDEKYTDN